MTACKSTFILLLMIAAAFLIITGCCGERQSAAGHIQPTLDGAESGPEVLARTRVSRPYGKMRVPADLFVDLIEPEQTTDPVSIIVSASSAVVAGSGAITLRVPDIAGEPGRTEVLWAGNTPDFITEVQQYAVPPLPAGKYHFVAILEFTPDREAAEPLVLSESLYVDVRTEEMLSSNVSFRQIERVALYRRLEERALETLSGGSANAKARTTARHYELMEAADPGLVEREIARLRAADPEVARQIMALNSTTADAEPDSDTPGRNEQGQPGLEKAVPIR